jgi:hypothetical protein
VPRKAVYALLFQSGAAALADLPAGSSRIDRLLAVTQAQ